MKELRVGIIGCGMISHRHMMIYSNIERLSERLGFKAKVVAAAEVDEARLAEWGAKYGMKYKDLYVDYRKMLKRGDIDAIDICVHNNLHTPISIEVMKAGIDCYCEKPSAASYHDAKMMIDAAEKLGRKYHVQMSSLMTLQTRKAKEMIKKSLLGDVYFAKIEQCAARRRPGYDFMPFAPDVKFTTDFYSKRIAGHGPSIDLGVYAIGQILFLLDMPKLESVSGFARQAMELDPKLISNEDGFGVEDICIGLAKFENGVGLGYMTTSAFNYRDYEHTYILGSKGGLDIAHTDMGGGKYARPFGEISEWGEPELRYRGGISGDDVFIDLNCKFNEETERVLSPEMQIYNDNQIMWLAYCLGILNDETRYNTPEIALQQLLFTDGIFLSEELGRSVTADEIIANSPALFLKEQEIAGRRVRFDVEY